LIRKTIYLQERIYRRYQEIALHNAKTLLLGIKIENKLGDKDVASSYELLLKNSFPDSDEALSLKKTIVLKNKEVNKNNEVKKNQPDTRENKPIETSERALSINTNQDKDAIKFSIDEWVNSWNSQDVNRYLACYADGFIPSNGLSKNKWEKKRSKRFTRSGINKSHSIESKI
jgi:Tfp pilus assembly protein PilF